MFQNLKLFDMTHNLKLLQNPTLLGRKSMIVEI